MVPCATGPPQPRESETHPRNSAGWSKRAAALCPLPPIDARGPVGEPIRNLGPRPEALRANKLFLSIDSTIFCPFQKKLEGRQLPTDEYSVFFLVMTRKTK